MNRNETDSAKRKTDNFPVWGPDGRLMPGLTFLTASGEVIISLDGASPGAAAADIVPVADGYFFYRASQTETDVAVDFQVTARKKALIDLAAFTTNCTTKVRAKSYGIAGNDFTITFFGDAGAAGVGVLTLVGTDYLFTFKPTVTTVANFETAITASTYLEVATAGATHALASGVDEFGPGRLTNGVFSSCTQKIDQYQPGMDNKLDEIIDLLGSTGGAHAFCPIGDDLSLGDMVLEARIGGTIGNDYTITIDSPDVADTTLEEVGTDIFIHLRGVGNTSAEIEALINGDSTLARVKTSDTTPGNVWNGITAVGGPFPFSGGTDDSAGIVDANVVEWKGVPPLDLDVFQRVQASCPFNVTDIATAVWNAVAEGSDTYGDFQRLFNAVLAGLASGFDTGTIAFRSSNGATIRLTVVTNSTGRVSIMRGTLTA